MSQQLPAEWVLTDDRSNAVLAWVFAAVLGVAAVGNLLAGLLVTAAVAASAVATVVVPAVVHRSWRRTVPWPLVLVASLPLLVSAVDSSFASGFLSAIGIATLALLVVVDLGLVTRIRMTPNFAIVVVVIATMGLTGFWALGSAASAASLDTTFVETNEELMWIFVAATLAGIVAGGSFRWYFRRRLAATGGDRTVKESRESGRRAGERSPENVKGSETDGESESAKGSGRRRIRDRLGVSERWQARLVWLLQALMVGIILAGLWLANGGVVVNAGIGLTVTLLPALLRRRYTFTMDVGLVLWITTAMFLHALGTLPLPGLGFLSPYSALDWWDHMTHAFSASLVAGVAYATARALEEHSPYISMGPRFRFVYLLLFGMAFGVGWELLEFAIGEGARLFGLPEVLTQYGLGDTVLDLFYDTLGGVLVALLGTAHLAGVAEQLSARMDARSTER